MTCAESLDHQLQSACAFLDPRIDVYNLAGNIRMDDRFLIHRLHAPKEDSLNELRTPNKDCVWLVVQRGFGSLGPPCSIENI